MKYTSALKKLGLTQDQAKIYEVLLSSPTLPARVVATRAGIGRELTYIVLGQLEHIGLVEKSTDTKVISFSAKHPSNTKQILEEKKSEMVSAEQAYQEIISLMVSDFNVTHKKPFIRFYEGLTGLQKTYDHIVRNAKTVYVIRSLYDHENEDIRTMVTKQLKRQSEKNIQSYVLSPHLPHMGKSIRSHNLERNITRKIIPKEKFTLPAQVIIYNNTVSITTLRKDIITTIIESDDIAKTFISLFKYMWDTDEVVN